MKKIVFLLLFIALIAVANVNAQKVNEKVQIQHNSTWYDGKILKIEGDKYYVSYDGWDKSWNEWVTVDNLRGYHTAPQAQPLTKFQVGDKVEVEYGMVPAPATVIEVGENKYHIKFDKALFGDRWVTEKQMKKL